MTGIERKGREGKDSEERMARKDFAFGWEGKERMARRGRKG